MESLSRPGKDGTPPVLYGVRYRTRCTPKSVPVGVFLPRPLVGRTTGDRTDTDDPPPSVSFPVPGQDGCSRGTGRGPLPSTSVLRSRKGRLSGGPVPRLPYPVRTRLHPGSPFLRTVTLHHLPGTERVRGLGSFPEDRHRGGLAPLDPRNGGTVPECKHILILRIRRFRLEDPGGGPQGYRPRRVPVTPNTRGVSLFTIGGGRGGSKSCSGTRNPHPAPLTQIPESCRRCVSVLNPECSVLNRSFKRSRLRTKPYGGDPRSTVVKSRFTLKHFALGPRSISLSLSSFPRL